jgi:hypothetical protein
VHSLAADLGDPVGASGKPLSLAGRTNASSRVIAWRAVGLVAAREPPRIGSSDGLDDLRAASAQEIGGVDPTSVVRIGDRDLHGCSLSNVSIMLDARET